MHAQRITTLGQFIIERQAEFPYSKGQLSRLLRDIGIASKIVNREVNKAGLVNILGDTGETNIQGETVKKLDLFANEQFKAALKAGVNAAFLRPKRTMKSRPLRVLFRPMPNTPF